jgi:hypothetical protein
MPSFCAIMYNELRQVCNVQQTSQGIHCWICNQCVIRRPDVANDVNALRTPVCCGAADRSVNTCFT